MSYLRESEGQRIVGEEQKILVFDRVLQPRCLLEPVADFLPCCPLLSPALKPARHWARLWILLYSHAARCQRKIAVQRDVCNARCRVPCRRRGSPFFHRAPIAGLDSFVSIRVIRGSHYSVRSSIPHSLLSLFQKDLRVSGESAILAQSLFGTNCGHYWGI